MLLIVKKRLGLQYNTLEIILSIIGIVMLLSGFALIMLSEFGGLEFEKLKAVILFLGGTVLLYVNEIPILIKKIEKG